MDAAFLPLVRRNAVRRRLHALADNLGSFQRTPATPEPIQDWPPRRLKAS